MTLTGGMWSKRLMGDQQGDGQLGEHNHVLAHAIVRQYMSGYQLWV
jgi:hypothetical protein